MYKVIKEFRDIYDMSYIHKVGNPFESDDINRIKSLLERGLIEGDSSPSFDTLTKKELMQLLSDMDIVVDVKLTKAEVVKILQGK